MKNLILASNSPRRRDLLDQVQIHYTVDPSNSDEVIDHTLTPENLVIELARGKALDVAKRHHHSIVLAADTMVICDECFLGKPKDADEAENMLKMLSGKTHRVVTGVVLLDTETHRRLEAAETTNVTFGVLSSEEIRWYVESGEAFGKAGAYAIQGLAARFVERVEGCYNNIIGLPVYRVLNMLKEINR